MNDLLEVFRNLINPAWILNHGGLWLVLLIIFAETGLFLGCFLPGDSLLFIIGMALTTHSELYLLPQLQVGITGTIILMSIAGILGNATGYWIGKKSGVLLFNRKNSFFFKQSYLQQAKDFYDKRGASTIVIARFLPIIRTFAPIIAGIVLMNFRVFMVYNIIGCILWIVSIVLGGYFLGRSFPIIGEHIDLVVISIVAVTTLPIFYKIIRHRLKLKKDNRPL